MIGIGINGVDAVNELSKAQPTGFYDSLLPSPDIHGYKTSEMLYNWVTKGVEPPKFTAVTDVVLITRDNFKEELAKKGCNSPVELAPPRRGWSAEESLCNSLPISLISRHHHDVPWRKGLVRYQF